MIYDLSVDRWSICYVVICLTRGIISDLLRKPIRCFDYVPSTVFTRRSTEFSDDEISAAFKFLDLDHNLHIGAAEIRHILICMGELITDEEV